MEKRIDNMRRIYEKLIGVMDGLSIEQLNKIPAGMSNNIIWNFAHLPATQQRLFYMFSNLPTTIDTTFIKKYVSGTKPEGDVTAQEFADIKQLYANAIDKFEDDYKAGIFKEFNSYTTSSLGITMYNIDDAITTSTIHDGLHFGYIRALKHLV